MQWLRDSHPSLLPLHAHAPFPTALTAFWFLSFIPLPLSFYKPAKLNTLQKILANQEYRYSYAGLCRKSRLELSPQGAAAEGTDGVAIRTSRRAAKRTEGSMTTTGESGKIVTNGERL